MRLPELRGTQLEQRQDVRGAPERVGERATAAERQRGDDVAAHDRDDQASDGLRAALQLGEARELGVVPDPAEAELDLMRADRPSAGGSPGPGASVALQDLHVLVIDFVNTAGFGPDREDLQTPAALLA